jgi:peptide/nickel transport system ATP-binding protein
VPDPDPDRRLDFDALMGGRASHPGAWPRPFTLDATTEADLIDLGEGHFVRADRSADPAQLLRAAEPVA